MGLSKHACQSTSLHGKPYLLRIKIACAPVAMQKTASNDGERSLTDERRASATGTTGKTRTFPRHLTETYDIDSRIGAGTFSTVYRCVKRSTGQVFALKRIAKDDCPENSAKNIGSEISFMKLAGRHENIVGCYDVQLQGPWIHIVVDMFTGGDLIDVLNKHYQDYGRVKDPQLAYITRQMAMAIAHIHSLQIIHRDVKGENFLADRPNMGDPECTIALADFGSATRLQPGKRLAERVGTEAFWAPEVWQSDYEYLADVWAMGLTTFILLKGELPFEGQENVCVDGGPEIPFPSWCSNLCADFLRECISADQQRRPNAQKALQHKWLDASVIELRNIKSRSKNPVQCVTSCTSGMFKAVGAIACFAVSICGCCLDTLLSSVHETPKATSVTTDGEGTSAGSGSVPTSCPDDAADGIDITMLGQKEVISSTVAAAPGVNISTHVGIPPHMST